MQARATFDSQSSTRALMVLILAVVVALVVGGAGGYFVRALTFTASPVNDVHRPFVIEKAPYQSPAPLPTDQPIYDPKGYPVPY